MAYTKRTWLGRQGTGLNKFSIGGASPVTIVNQPDSVTQVGDALSAGNLNDLEDRIKAGFDDVDTALDTKADEQDVTNLNNAITQLDHRVQNLEQAKGDYVVSNYKDGAVTPSGKGDWAVVEGLRACSRVANQLMNKANYPASATYGNLTFTNNGDGSFTFSCPTALASDVTIPIESVTSAKGAVSGHTYVFKGGATNIRFGTGNGGASIDTGDGRVATITFGTSISMGFMVPQGTVISSPITVTPLLTDLNVYFNAFDLSFLGATDSAKLATIQKDNPHLLTPSEYGVRIVDSSYSGVRAWARNLFDEVWEVGSINNSTGQNESASSTWRGVNYISVSPNVTYYFKTSGLSLRFYWYDADKNFISSNTIIDSELTAPSNAWYLRIRDVTAGGPTYNNNVCVNQSDSQNGTYTSYHAPSTLSLTFQGKSAGAVADTLETNAEIVQEIDGQKVTIYKKRETQRVGSVDLATILNWVLDSDGFYRTTLDDILPPSGSSSIRLTCDKYVPISPKYSDEMGGQADNVICQSANSSGTTKSIYVKDSSGTPSGTLYYPLATESVTLSDPILDNTLLTESGGRMATVQTGTIVDGSFDMGFINL